MSIEMVHPALKTSRRAMPGGTVGGGLGLMTLGSAVGGAKAAGAQTTTRIYGVCCGKDMKSYLCVLTGHADIPVYRILISGDLPPPSAMNF